MDAKFLHTHTHTHTHTQRHTCTLNPHTNTQHKHTHTHTHTHTQTPTSIYTPFHRRTGSRLWLRLSDKMNSLTGGQVLGHKVRSLPGRLAGCLLVRASISIIHLLVPLQRPKEGVSTANSPHKRLCSGADLEVGGVPPLPVLTLPLSLLYKQPRNAAGGSNAP